MSCDFSTTGPNERIASVATLMKGLQTYFHYRVRHKICGIPQITLLGTPEDWKKLVNKADILKDFGLKSWYSWLSPILNEFVNTSEGHPNLKFWKSIVMTLPSDEFYRVPERVGCLPPDDVYIDGWFLALFLSVDRYHFDFSKHDKNTSLDSEISRVGFMYEVTDNHGFIVNKTPMELWSGFVGVDEDRDTFALKPCIGWFIRKSHQEEDEIKAYRSELEVRREIRINSDNLPEVLCKLGHINRLILQIRDKDFNYPDWFHTLDIGELLIIGCLTSEEETTLQNIFPQAIIDNWA